MWKRFVSLFCFASVAALPVKVFAEWTPLITSGSFTGIETDALTAATGILGIMIIVVAVGILVAVFVRH